MNFVNDLLEFFGHDNWPYLLDPAQYGIIDAKITTRHIVVCRIVLWMKSGNTWSVIKTRHSGDFVEASKIEYEGGRIITDPETYRVPELLPLLDR